jgi:hypothetical protein
MSAAGWLPLTPDSASGYLQQSRLIRSAYPTMPRRNATNHTNRRGRDCPSAPAMQHSGGANLTPACTVSHEMLSSKRKSSSLAGTARTAAFGQFGSPPGRSVASTASSSVVRHRSTPDAATPAWRLLRGKSSRVVETPVAATLRRWSDARCHAPARTGPGNAFAAPGPSNAARGGWASVVCLLDGRAVPRAETARTVGGCSPGSVRATAFG